MGFKKRLFSGRVIFFILMGMSPALATQPAQQQEQGSITFLDLKNVPVHETLEDALPKGALVYIRANNLQRMLENIDRLLTSFLPEKAIPPELKPVFSTPNPFLSFLGMKLFGDLVPPDQFSALTGVALDRPVSFALYPFDPEEAFIFSIPISDPVRLMDRIKQILRPSVFDKIDSGNMSAYHIVPSPSIFKGNLYLCSSENTAFFCSHIKTARSLANPADGETIGGDPAIACGLKNYKDSDLGVILSAEFIKSQLPSVKKRFSPELMTPRFRKGIFQFLLDLDPVARGYMEAQLRLQFGIDGIFEFIRYLEAAAIGTYRVIFEEFLQWLAVTDGLVVAVDFEERFLTTSLSVFSKKIDPIQWAQPLPKEEIMQALPYIPGNRTNLVAVGRTPQSVSSGRVERILDSVEYELRRRNLDSAVYEALKTYWINKQINPPIESKVPWTLRTAVDPSKKIGINGFSSFEKWLRAVVIGIHREQWARITLLPVAQKDIFEAAMENETRVTNQNEALFRELLEPKLEGRRFYAVEGRIQKEALEGGVHKLILEKSYKSRRGYLGYQQHELINRRISYTKEMGRYLLIADGNDDTRMTQLINQDRQPVAPSMTEWLQRAPSDVSSVRVVKTLHLIANLVDFLGNAEDLIHRELNDFLREANEVKSALTDDKNRKNRARLKFPILAMTLNMDNSGGLYCVMPGGLYFPRPKIVPKVRELLDDYLSVASNIGGVACYKTVNPGEMRVTIVQSMDALALLVKTSVDRFFDKYMTTEDGLGELMRILTHPDDGKRLRDEEVIRVNPSWALILR
jgi:hypothetical protein